MENYKSLSHDEKRLYWQEHIRAWKESGQSQIEYCQNQKIKKSTLGYWRTRLKRESGFIEIPIKIESTTPLEILISDNVKIQVKKGFDPELLIQTIRTLERLSC